MLRFWKKNFDFFLSEQVLSLRFVIWNKIKEEDERRVKHVALVWCTRISRRISEEININ